ncbi:hypothetical protein DPEC_G00082860 [Dallia pectoralis]|uniref:Uncharacterized protein n=1 Tax=Dallia pectoralis TaxID=75939 RepID=A0ACC2GYP4_DALPE|nr:hypothetical protein DPEC_G00082860 [Dallia pectoralis]
MRLAGLRSDQLGISREPQFLSKRKVPSSHALEVSSSFQWNPTTTKTPQRRVENPRPGRPTPERAQTPVATRGRPNGPTGDPQQGTTALHPDSAVLPVQTQTQSALGAVRRQESAFNGVHHVLKRKAGLKSSEKRLGLQKTEYENQFQWKIHADQASPLLAAEQMLYASHLPIPPFKSNPVVMESEYSRNFKASPPPRKPPLRKDVVENMVPPSWRENVSTEKSVKSRRKKKREQRGRTYSDLPKNIPVPKPHERQREQGTLQKEVKLQSPRKVHLPHRKIRTEYHSNFRSPLNYTYKDGVWVKTTSGVQEVRELREKAEAYKRRSWGTHFSRLHLNQILSDQNQLWEASTPSSSSLTPGTVSGDGEDDRGTSPNIQALDLAGLNSGEGSSSSVSGHPASIPSVSSRRSSVRGAGETAGPSYPPDTGALAVPVQRRLAWEENASMPRGKDGTRKEEEEEDENAEEDKVERRNELMLQEHSSVSSSDGSHSPVEGGRMPTPTLHRTATVQRTHHDLTTPATGGAILVSPPKMKDSRVRSEAPLGKPSSPFKLLSQAAQKREPTQAERRNQLPASAEAGLPTMDPFPLREDSWSREKSQENPHDPPPLRDEMSRKHTTSGQPQIVVPPPVNRIQGMLRDPEFQHNGNLGLRASELLLCPNGGCGTDDEDDRMSQISSRSAESCDRASQVLGRAQRRNEDFWRKR